MKKTLFFFILATASIICGEEWNMVYLASFPRSGNHWVRFLVEEATHVTTSSVYQDSDFPHLSYVFSWGGYCTDHGYQGNCRYPTLADPVLLKTHHPCFAKALDPRAKATICLIRHPIDTFYSFYMYQKQGSKSTKMSQRTLKNFIREWRRFYEFWEKQPNVILIRYEDLYENPELNLAYILQTAGFLFSYTDIQQAVRKYPPRGGVLKHIAYYDHKMIKMIKNELYDLLMKYGYDL